MQDPLVRSTPPKRIRRSPSSAPKQARQRPRVAPEAHAKADGYIPFRDRFRAWWDGVEPEAVVRKGQTAKTSKTRRLIELDSEDNLQNNVDWGAARVRICDWVWGHGFVGPGGGNYGIDMARPFSARAESLVLDLSAGLGGRVHEIALNPDVTVAGLEQEPDFAETALERTKKLDHGNIRSIAAYNPNRIDLAGLKYDCILARELFFTIEDKRALFATLGDGLRRKGTLAFTDFVLAEHDQNEGPVMADWQETEPMRPLPWSLSEYRKELEALNFELVAFGDDSDRYRELVLRAWRQYADGLDQVTFDRTLVDALIQEAQLWLHRIRAIESGQLRVLSVVAKRR